MDKNLISKIRSRQRKLQKAKVELKKHFVGIDDIIDKVIKDVETWYVMPELLSRPTIVCLFGPTGVGKTDLVRRLVKLLHVQDCFCELTLSNRGCPSHPWSNSIASILCDSNVKSGQPSVIMMDEIQNFRTIDHEGNDIHDCKFKDVWTLLSDGKLPYMVEVDNLMGMLWDIQQKEDEPNKKRVPKSGGAPSKDDDDDDDDGHITSHFYQLNHFKSALRLEEPIEEIAKWTDAKRKQVILKRLADKSIFEEEDYTKCLIFISGNLDEAYGFAKDVKEVDVDADILHEMSKKIGILDIKQALTKRFKPEQISRMGNGHIIYSSLSKSSFRTIIERKITAIKDRVYSHFGISVTIDSSINELIYNNGVYPTQGTRPLFSTISDVIESSLPCFLLKAILKDTDKVYIDYKNELIRGKVGNSIVKRKYEGVIDKLKKERRINRDRRTLTAVHEAGHAVGFASLFKFTPSQIVATPASNDTDGFVYTLKSCSSKNMARRSLCVLLAGQAAEKIFFGSDNVTSGSSNDLYKATERASMMIRKWGMGNYVSTIANQEMDYLNNDQDGSNNMIEALLQECKLEIEEVLNKNIGLMEEVIDTLLVVDKILPADFVSICAKHGLKIGEPLSSEEMIFWKYSDAYNETKNSRKKA